MGEQDKNPPMASVDIPRRKKVSRETSDRIAKSYWYRQRIVDHGRLHLVSARISEYSGLGRVGWFCCIKYQEKKEGLLLNGFR